LTLPNDIQETLDFVAVEMRQSLDYSLLPKHRLSIYRAINSYDGQLADKFFSWLDFLTAQHLENIWNQEMASDDFVPRMLTVAEGLLQGTLTLEQTKDERDLFYHAAGSLTYNEDVSSKAQNTMLAAYNALQTVYGITPFQYADLEQIERGFSDEIVAGLSVADTAAYAVLAYAGFNVDYEYEADITESEIEGEETLFEPEKRLEFWEWWLFEAILQAWELTQTF